MSYIKIQKFLEDFDGLIFLEHQRILEEYFELLNKTGNYNEEPILSKYGLHFKSCSWSNNKATMGPDTCCCGRHKKLKSKIDNFIMRYYLLSERLK